MAKRQKALLQHELSQLQQRIQAMVRGNNMPDNSDMCQEELDQWSDINNPNNEADMDDWADSHNPNNDNFIGE